jgi:outer membrane protein assembly factor BamB
VTVKLDRRRPDQPPFKGSGEYNPLTLVAAGDSVFAVLRADGPLVKLDARTGEVLMTYEEPGPDQVLYHQGRLILTGKVGKVRSLDAASGKLCWEYNPPENQQLTGAAFPHVKWRLKVAAGGGQLFFLEEGEQGVEAVSLELASGRERWRRKRESWKASSEPEQDPRLVAYHEGIIVLEDTRGEQGAVHALQGTDGGHLWSFPYRPVYPGGNTFFQGGLLWLLSSRPSEWIGIDPVSGKERKRIRWSAYGPRRNSKGRCYAYKATSRFILCGDADLLDTEVSETYYLDGVRGACGHGVVPANGLLIFMPQDCICRPFLRGFVALASDEDRQGVAQTGGGSRLQLGPAAEAMSRAEASPGQNDWPCYRHDSRRSGCTGVHVPAGLELLWQARVASPVPGLGEDYWQTVQEEATLSAPVMAGGTVFVASRETHQLLALEGEDGRLRWSFTAGGRVDVPPTILEGLCLFGCRDGWVYCLRAEDGELVWRFPAAAHDRQIVVDEQLESPRPVTGSILVEKGVAYFAAGRHSALDGGIAVYALDPYTGRMLWKQPLAGGSNGFDGLGGALTSDGRCIYLGDREFEPETGQNRKVDWSSYWRPAEAISKVGRKQEYLQTGAGAFLDGSWSNRCWWCDGRAAGHLLVFDRTRTFGVKAFEPPGWDNFARMNTPGRGAYRLFAESGRDAPDWLIQAPVRVQSMVLAGDTLFVAGPEDSFQPGKSQLWAFSALDGESLSVLPLDAPPVFDGMAAADGKLYISTLDGMILCFGKK